MSLSIDYFVALIWFQVILWYITFNLFWFLVPITSLPGCRRDVNVNRSNKRYCRQSKYLFTIWNKKRCLFNDQEWGRFAYLTFLRISALLTQLTNNNFISMFHHLKAMPSSNKSSHYVLQFQWITLQHLSIKFELRPSCKMFFMLEIQEIDI